MIKKAKIFSILSVFMLVGAIGAGVWWSQRDVKPEMTTEMVKRGDVVQTVDLTGYLEKPNTLHLAFSTSGEVKSMAEVGDFIRKDAVIGTVEFMETIVDMKSPIDGTITRVDVNVGELASAGMPVVEIETASEDFIVSAYAAESDITSLSIGQPATMTLGAFGKDVVFTGEVMNIAPSATLIEGVPFFALELSLDEQADGGKGDMEGLRSGMSVDIAVVTKKSTGVLYIPTRAVITKNGEKFVRIPDDTNENFYVERQVTLGDRGDNSVVIVKSGLHEGDTVILSIKE
jgi:multidrug efflux pump subunit AcrA (membrane-fusion protein)